MAACYHCEHIVRRRPGAAATTYYVPDQADKWREKGIRHWHLYCERVQREANDQKKLQARWVRLVDQHGDSAGNPRAVLDWALPRLRHAYAQRTGVRGTCYARLLAEWDADEPTRYGWLTAGDNLYLTVHLEPGLEYHIIARATPCSA